MPANPLKNKKSDIYNHCHPNPPLLPSVCCPSSLPLSLQSRWLLCQTGHAVDDLACTATIVTSPILKTQSDSSEKKEKDGAKVSGISAVVRYGVNNKRKDHSCVDGWMNDRQEEEQQRRKGSQERCCGVIEPRLNGGCVVRMRGKRDAGLVAFQWLQPRRGGAENEGKWWLRVTTKLVAAHQLSEFFSAHKTRERRDKKLTDYTEKQDHLHVNFAFAKYTYKLSYWVICSSPLHLSLYSTFLGVSKNGFQETSLYLTKTQCLWLMNLLDVCGSVPIK